MISNETRRVLGDFFAFDGVPGGEGFGGGLDLIECVELRPVPGVVVTGILSDAFAMTRCSNILASPSLELSRRQFATVSLMSKWKRA